MKVNMICDICNKPIFINARFLEMNKFTENEGIIDTIWKVELCLACSLGIESEVNRRKKIMGMKK